MAKKKSDRTYVNKDSLHPSFPPSFILVMFEGKQGCTGVEGIQLATMKLN